MIEIFARIIGKLVGRLLGWLCINLVLMILFPVLFIVMTPIFLVASAFGDDSYGSTLARNYGQLFAHWSSWSYQS